VDHNRLQRTQKESDPRIEADQSHSADRLSHRLDHVDRLANLAETLDDRELASAWTSWELPDAMFSHLLPDAMFNHLLPDAMFNHLKDLGCGPGNEPYVAAGLIRNFLTPKNQERLTYQQRDLAKAFSAKSCAGANGLSKDTISRLKAAANAADANVELKPAAAR
jgi:hypothetical protein